MSATIAVRERDKEPDSLHKENRVDHEMRILVLAPTSNDARLTAQFLEKAGLQTTVCADIRELCARLHAACGAVLVAEEALSMDSVPLLTKALDSQPSWSDLPLVLITGVGEAEIRRRRLAKLGPAGNVSIIERPVRPDTLVSALEVALRSRRRQYQVRALLEEREATAAKTEQQSRIFDTTLSSIADFAYILDRAGRFLYANKALLDFWGCALDDVVGKTFLELPHPAELAAKLHQQVLQVFESGRPLRDETSYTAPAGITGYYEYIFSPVFGAEGQVEVVAGSTRETSDRRRSEEALRDAHRRKDEFLAMLAHELRNPLASVANAAALLKGTADDESREWAAGVIERQSRSLALLIDDLLDVSRITTGKIRLRKEIVDLATLLDRARESAASLMQERGHELFCQYEHGALWLDADPTRVEQVVSNLLTNATKYTPSGGRIRLSAARKDDDVLISVQDNGIGIAQSRIPEMFQLFAQGERSIARSEGGLGIGLTIVQKLVELHGGRVDAVSDGPGRGSTFTVRLPAATVPMGFQPKQSAPRGMHSARPLRILIVDDNVSTAQALGRLLVRDGHQIELAHDGREALQQAREFEPDAIVLDIGLPGMDGFHVARQLRLEPCCADALIIAVTGYGQEEDRKNALGAGFDYHLVKPVDLEELYRILAGPRCVRPDRISP